MTIDLPWLVKHSQPLYKSCDTSGTWPNHDNLTQKQLTRYEKENCDIGQSQNIIFYLPTHSLQSRLPFVLFTMIPGELHIGSLIDILGIYYLGNIVPRETVTVSVDDGSLQVDSQSTSVDLVWGLVTAWRSVCIHRVNRVNSHRVKPRVKPISDVVLFPLLLP